ncbi:MAG: hypothetical protein HY547_00995 [Elusimicrobia bacterium]|nr:hypothetical protein [Elusimicrobiota bacterium]
MSPLTQWTLAYASHVGFENRKESIIAEIRRRQKTIPRGAFYLLQTGAWFLYHLSPLLFMGECKKFASLSASHQERLLARLQNTEILTLKKIFFSVKSLTLEACYGNADQLQKIGYAQNPRI